MTDEEITALQQELEGTKETLSLTQGQLEGARAQAETLKETLSLTQGQLAEKGALVEANEQDLATLRDQLGEKDRLITTAVETMTEAVTRYKASVVAANPTVPADMVTGESIADIDAHLETAKALVTRVRETLAEEAKATPVPPGAPARTEPDISAMSPTQKIQHALRKEGK